MRSVAESIIHTPDGRYIIVKGTLWRTSNPALSDKERIRLVSELMDARRRVRTINAEQRAIARKDVDAAKRSLGERGPVWWTDGSPDYSRHKVYNTPYADWYRKLAQAKDCSLA